MAIVLSSTNGFLIDHNLGVAQVLKGTASRTKDADTIKNLMFKKELFQIEQPFMMDSQFAAMQDRIKSKTTPDKIQKQKRKRKSEMTTGEENFKEYHEKICNILIAAYENILEATYQKNYFQKEGKSNISEPHLPSEISSGTRGASNSLTKADFYDNLDVKSKSSTDAEPLPDNNRAARHTAMKLQDTAETLGEVCFSRRNISSSMPKVTNKLTADMLHWRLEPCNKIFSNTCGYPAIFNFNEDQYILPANSTFFLSDFTNLGEMVCYEDFSPFECIVMDPPWENKSVKRKKMYKTLTSQDFSKIPIPGLAAANALLIVWVTNRMKHVDFIKECLFPAWNVQYITDWFWIKVTTKGDMVYDINSDHKKPYELMVLGQYKPGHQEASAEKSVVDIPQNLVIASVPSALHSMKPPLNDILVKFLPEKRRCLELFARSLWPGWTSWGNEVLLHQHIDFYQNQDS